MSGNAPLKFPALDPRSQEKTPRRNYPGGLGPNVSASDRWVIGDTLGLTQFGANMVSLPPGKMSALRHWHSAEDELVIILEGELTLVTNNGEQVLGPGTVAGFPAGKEDAHHLINKSDAPAVFIELGHRSKDGDDVTYPDDDIFLEKRPGGIQFYKKSGEKY